MTVELDMLGVYISFYISFCFMVVLYTVVYVIDIFDSIIVLYIYIYIYIYISSLDMTVSNYSFYVLYVSSRIYCIIDDLF